MTEVRFYHLTRKRLEEALPELLTKTLDRGWRAVVMARSQERVESLNTLLWTYDDRSFLPHGSKSDGYADDHPIWLTAEDENPNGAGVLFLTDGAETQNAGLYELVCVMFDGNDDQAVAAAREQWTVHTDAGRHLTYWQQKDRGGWEKKAETGGEAAG